MAGPCSIAPQASLRQLDEGAGAVREAHSFRGKAVLFLRAHLTEGAVKSVGQKQRIVAKAGIAARRPSNDAIDAAFEFFHVTVGPGEAKRSDEMGMTLLGAFGVAFDVAFFVS